MNRLAPPEHGAARAHSGMVANRSHGDEPRPEPALIPTIPIPLLCLAQTYLRAQDLGYATGPSLAVAWDQFAASLDPLIRTQAAVCRCPAQEVDDLVQEVWIVVCLRLRTYRHDPERGRFDDWLFVIVHHTLANWRRHEARRHGEDLVIAVVDRWVSHESNPAEALERSERIEHVRHALAAFRVRVDVVAFRVVELHWIEARSIQDVADELQLSHTQVRGCLYRLKPKLGEWLESQGITASEK